MDQVRAYCTYHGGFHDKHIVVLWLWQALREFTNEQRARFLKFVTSSDRVGARAGQELMPSATSDASGYGIVC